MFYITGDTHGNQTKWLQQLHPTLSSGDILLVAGDFGIGFWATHQRSEESFLDWLGEQSYTVLFIDGNHENFDKLNAYPTESWHGGRVHRLRHNIFHLMRGEIYSIEGQTLFVMGGGNSMDKRLRREHISWWREEMPSQEEYKHAAQNLKKAGYKVDTIVTHTAPYETIVYLCNILHWNINEASEEFPLMTFLDTVQKTVSYTRWYCGHLHIDCTLWRQQTLLFNCIRELNTGRVIRQWNAYKE